MYVEELPSLLKLLTVILVEVYLAQNMTAFFFFNYKLEIFYYYKKKKKTLTPLIYNVKMSD